MAEREPPAATLAYVALGGNVGDSGCRLDAAVAALVALAVPPSSLRESARYRSAPMGPEDQGDYLNSVVRLRTALGPFELLDALQAIERDEGRMRARERRWGPRTLDLDLLLFGERTIASSRLTVPHPGAGSRAFVLAPLAELDPELLIPGEGKVAELLARVGRAGLRRLDPASGARSIP